MDRISEISFRRASARRASHRFRGLAKVYRISLEFCRPQTNTYIATTALQPSRRRIGKLTQ
jgi:hypothetical protein